MFCQNRNVQINLWRTSLNLGWFECDLCRDNCTLSVYIPGESNQWKKRFRVKTGNYQVIKKTRAKMIRFVYAEIFLKSKIGKKRGSLTHLECMYVSLNLTWTLVRVFKVPQERHVKRNVSTLWNGSVTCRIPLWKPPSPTTTEVRVNILKELRRGENKTNKSCNLYFVSQSSVIACQRHVLRSTAYSYDRIVAVVRQMPFCVSNGPIVSLFSYGEM